MIYCLNCPAPHQCAQEDECCADGYSRAKAQDAERQKLIASIESKMGKDIAAKVIQSIDEQTLGQDA